MKNNRQGKWTLKDLYILPLVIFSTVFGFVLWIIQSSFNEVVKLYFWITYVFPILYIFQFYGVIKGLISIPLLYLFNFTIGVPALVMVIRTLKLFPKVKTVLLIQSFNILLSLVIYSLLDFDLLIILSSIICGLLHGLLVPESKLYKERSERDAYKKDKFI